MDDNSPTLLPCGSGRLLPPMPLPPHLRQAADGDMPTLDHLAREINVRLQRAAQADDHRIAAGRLLIDAQKRVEAGEAGDITWSDWVKQYIERSPGDVRKVMSLARADDPVTARGQEKERARRGMARLRHERANVSAPPQPCADETAEDLPGEVLARWDRLCASNRGELLRQLWLALTPTEQAEFLSWLAPQAKAWSIERERFLAFCRGAEGVPGSGEQGNEIRPPAAEVSQAYQSAA